MACPRQRPTESILSCNSVVQETHPQWAADEFGPAETAGVLLFRGAELQHHQPPEPPQEPEQPEQPPPPEVLVYWPYRAFKVRTALYQPEKDAPRRSSEPPSPCAASPPKRFNSLPIDWTTAAGTKTHYVPR